MNKVPSYRLKGVLSINKVQSAKDQSRLRIFVALHPALPQQVPLGLKVSTKLASESRLQSSEQHGNAVVSRGLCQLRIAVVVELDGMSGRQRFGASVGKAVTGRLFRGERGKRQQGGREELEPPHCVGERGVWWVCRAVEGRDMG